MVEHRVFHLLRRATARRNRGIAGCDPAPGSALRKRPAPVGCDGRRHDRPAVEYSMGRSNAVAVSAAKHGAVGHGLAARHRGLEHVGRGRLGDAHTAALEPLDTLDLGCILFRLAGSAIRHHDALLPADLSAAAYVRRVGHARAVAQPAAHAGADDGYPVRHFAAAAGRPSASPFDHSRRHRVRGAGNLGLGLGLYADLYSPLHSHRRGGLDKERRARRHNQHLGDLGRPAAAAAGSLQSNHNLSLRRRRAQKIPRRRRGGRRLDCSARPGPTMWC